MTYSASIGLEVHVQLRTNTKIWCGCKNQYGSDPNTNVCPICLGYPGAMPVLNKEAVKLTVMSGLLIGSEISSYSKFDRKNYFYPDASKNYQITQYDKPFCVGGSVDIEVEGKKKTIRVNRIHLEEDVAKNTHFETSSGVDFNRAGTPLMEIVTEPDMENEEEAFAFLLALKQILQYGEVSDCNLEEGNIRCDVNCSVRPEGQEELGTKTEIKNMNTFKGVHRALKAEIRRQCKVIDEGGQIIQETRRWDDVAGVTAGMRSKEYAHDYRYFPEPDLVPIVLQPSQVEEWKHALPELPADRRHRLVEQYEIPEYDAGVIAADKRVADFYEAAAGKSDNPKGISNWVMTEVLRSLAEKELEISDVSLSPEALAQLVGLVDSKAINMTGAKEIFAELFEKGGDPKQIVEAKGLAQVSDEGALEALADEVIAEHTKSVDDYKSGKAAAMQFLVGQIMRLSKGKANPQVAREILTRKIEG